MSLFTRISEVQTGNHFFQKDLKKAKGATKFIGHGSIASSTHKYMVAAGDLANSGSYTNKDVVFVSAEGARNGRKPTNLEELKKAVEAKSKIITDDLYNRSRPYNVGEREIAEFLTSNGYTDDDTGIWTI